jgi:hypothetical protein
MRSLWLSEGLQHLGQGPFFRAPRKHQSSCKRLNLRIWWRVHCMPPTTTDTLKRKLVKGFDGDGVFDRHQNARASQNLTRLGSVRS